MHKKFISLILVLGIIVLNFGFLVAPSPAMAASLTVMSDTVTNLTTNVGASQTIVFTTPSGVPANGVVTLTFDNSTSTTNVVYSDITLKDGASTLSVQNGGASGSTWGFSNASPVITLTNGSAPILATHAVTITIGNNHITNGAVGTTHLVIAGSTGFNDTGTVSMAIVSNGVVTVSAQVLSSLSFALSGNAVYFGNLQTGNTCWAESSDPGNVTCPITSEAEAFNMTAATNGSSGYTISVEGPTLTSGLNTITPLSVATAPSTGSSQFGMRANVSGSGSGAVSSPFATAGQYAWTATASVPVTVATAAAATLSNTYSVRYMANISAITSAGSYAASHTYVATGNF
jgi:hypothetical protein